MSKLLTAKLAKARNNLRQTQKELKQRMKLLAHPTISDIWRALPPSLRKGTRIYVSSYGTIYFNTDVSGITSFKTDPRLLRVLELFAGTGWQAQTSDWTGGYVPNRDFTFTRTIPASEDYPAFTIGVTVSAYAKSDSPTCRIVVKQTKEEVIREDRTIVCD